MSTLVFLLEEPSARDRLEGLLPRLLPAGVEVVFFVFEGQQDLEKRMVRRIRSWLKPDTRFVVLRDQDAAECLAVKRRLVSLVEEADRADALVRIACRELESWILGDWNALATAYQRPGVATLGRRAIYRNPDRLTLPVQEIRKHIPEYQKRDGARRVGKLLDPKDNQARSFAVFCDGVSRLVADVS